MLTATCCGCIGSSKSRYLLCCSSVADLFRQDQIHVIIITWHSWMVFSCIGSQWACCSTFKYMTSACCSSLQRASETLHLPQLHLYRSATRWFMYAIWGLFHACYICSSNISYMLTAACCGCIGNSKSRYLLCRSSSSSSNVADLLHQDQIHSHCHEHYHANPSESCDDRNINIPHSLYMKSEFLL